MRIQLFACGSVGARCAYFPIIGAGGMSRKRRCLGPVCQTDHSRVKTGRALSITDFDLDKTAGQAHVQRCHGMVACSFLIVFGRVLNVTAARPPPRPSEIL